LRTSGPIRRMRRNDPTSIVPNHHPVARDGASNREAAPRALAVGGERFSGRTDKPGAALTGPGMTPAGSPARSDRDRVRNRRSRGLECSRPVAQVGAAPARASPRWAHAWLTRKAACPPSPAHSGAGTAAARSHRFHRAQAPVGVDRLAWEWQRRCPPSAPIRSVGRIGPVRLRASNTGDNGLAGPSNTSPAAHRRLILWLRGRPSNVKLR
jgi:hypothetical protein